MWLSGGPVPGPVVVAEVHGSWLEPAHLLQRPTEGRVVFHHALAWCLAVEHPHCPAGIAGQEGRAGAGIDLDALMACGMARGGDHPDAGHDLAPPVDQLVARAGVIEPGRGRVRVPVATFVLGSLYVEGRLGEHGVLA